MFTAPHEDVPLPDKRAYPFEYQGQPIKYPDARTLEVGKSVHYPGSMFATRQERRLLTTGFRMYGIRNGKKFVNKYDEDGGVRIWRVA